MNGPADVSLYVFNNSLVNPKARYSPHVNNCSSNSSLNSPSNQDRLEVTAYDIEVEDDQSFFDAYIESLNEAFVDLVVENEALVSVLDDIYYETIESAYDVSIHPD